MDGERRRGMHSSQGKDAVFFKIFVVLLWFLVGSAISLPYAFLADGDLFLDKNLEWWLLMILIAPIATLSLCVAHVLVEFSPPEKKSGFVVLFWILAFYWFSPVLLNLASFWVKRVGYEAFGSYMFRYRYFSLIIAPPVIAICWSVWNKISQRKGGKNV